MAIGLEALSAELFDQILSHISEYDERRNLSSVSRALNKKMIPHLYTSWCFDGNKHTFKSLHYFFRSIVLNPELASHVRKLNIRQRGNGEPDDPPYYLCFPVADEVSDRGEPPSESPEDEAYKEEILLFQNSLKNYGFDEATIKWLNAWIENRDPDRLLAILLIKLPNLKQWNMAVPETQITIPYLVERIFREETTLFLRKLESINICPSLHMGVSTPSPTNLSIPKR
jgi:hypothetical protein